MIVIKDRSKRPGLQRALRTGFAVIALTVGLSSPVCAQPATVSAAAPFEWIKVRDKFYVISGPDGNVGVQLGTDGVLVIDAQRAELADALLVEIKKIAGASPIRFLINTNGDPGHTGANEAIRTAGRQLFGGDMALAGQLASVAVHVAHENVQVRLTSGEAGAGAYPLEIFTTPMYDFYFNGEGIVLIHAPASHSDGDILVHLRASDVVLAGEVWNTQTYPVIDLAHGGSIQGEIDALNKLIELAIVHEFQEGGTMIVPGRGRVGDESDLVDYRDMVTIIRDRIKAMADQGMSLKQIQAARPTRDYDGRWGATSGPWTTEMFVSAVYEGVQPERRQGTRASR